MRYDKRLVSWANQYVKSTRAEGDLSRSGEGFTMLALPTLSNIPPPRRTPNPSRSDHAEGSPAATDNTSWVQ